MTSVIKGTTPELTKGRKSYSLRNVA